MKGYDYSKDNLYFVTSCVYKMVCCFGHIVGTGRDLSLQSEKQMELNEYGKIADNQWYWLGEHYPFVVLHEFVVMPNHIHGIIEIDRSRIVVGTGCDLSLQSIKIKSLSELMGAYKTTTSNKIHEIGFDGFKWQRSFHDHIIRDEKSYNTISNYIRNNPKIWNQDELFNTDQKSIK
jgi:putative transposase